MRIRSKSTLVIGVLLGSMLTGCQLVESPNDLIEAPQQEKKANKELSDKAKQLLPAQSELLTPKKAETRQSIFIADVNRDGKQEAFLLYRSLGENRKVHLLTLKETNNEWEKVADIEMDHFQLDYFNLLDLDNDKDTEIVIGLGMSDFESENQLIIYQWDDRGLKKKVEKNYQIVDIYDYDGDNQLDILLVHGKRRESMQAEMFRYQDNQLESRSIVKTEAFGFHENIVRGKLHDGNRALFIDSGVGAHSMITEIIAFDGQNLIKVDEKASMLIKEYPIYSKDINHDGVIEVGGMYIPKGWEDAAFAQIPFIDFYSSYSIKGDEKKVEERVTNRAQKFYITIPPNWHEKVTIKKLENGMQLYSLSNEELLFEVKWIGAASGDPSGHVLKETKDTIFYTEMKENDAFPFRQFHLLEDEF